MSIEEFNSRMFRYGRRPEAHHCMFCMNKILSPAVAWVNWENKDSWKWFLENVAAFEKGLLEKIVKREGNVFFSKRWARSHMTHLRTFGLMTNNLAEQHNKLMKDGGHTG